MKYLNFSKKLAAFAMSVLVLSACDKVVTPDPMGDAGQTIVKFVESYKLLNVDFIPTPQTIELVDLRRDIPNSTELGREMTIIVKDDPGAVTAYDPALIPPPPGMVVIDPSIPKVGVNYTFKMKAGDFAKVMKATITNASLLSLSNRYGIGFSIVSADADGKIQGSKKTMVIEIGAKNQYDGLYRDNGTFVDLINPAFVSAYPLTYALITSGANQCEVWNVNLNGGLPGFNFLNGTTGTYYGSYGYVIGFDPATGNINDFHNYYGEPGRAVTGGGDPGLGTGPPNFASSNTRRAVLDPSGANKFDFATKNITIKHWMIQTNQPTGTGPRATFNETWTYLGPR